jgi:hypothetical protein
VTNREGAVSFCGLLVLFRSLRSLCFPLCFAASLSHSLNVALPCFCLVPFVVFVLFCLIVSSSFALCLGGVLSILSVLVLVFALGSIETNFGWSVSLSVCLSVRLSVCLSVCLCHIYLVKKKKKRKKEKEKRIQYKNNSRGITTPVKIDHLLIPVKKRSSSNTSKDRLSSNTSKERSSSNTSKDRSSLIPVKKRSSSNTSKDSYLLIPVKIGYLLIPVKKRPSSNTSKEKTIF